MAKRWLDCLNFVFNWLETDKYLDSTKAPARGGTIFDIRRSTDFDPALVGRAGERVRKNIESMWFSDMIYSAAIASFELWGSCELSRTLLREASKKNPIIIRKILGRAEAPSALSISGPGF